MGRQLTAAGGSTTSRPGPSRGPATTTSTTRTSTGTATPTTGCPSSGSTPLAGYRRARELLSHDMGAAGALRGASTCCSRPPRSTTRWSRRPSPSARKVGARDDARGRPRPVAATGATSSTPPFTRDEARSVRALLPLDAWPQRHRTRSTPAPSSRSRSSRGTSVATGVLERLRHAVRPAVLLLRREPRRLRAGVRPRRLRGRRSSPSTPPTTGMGAQFGLLGFADDNWVDGTQSYVFTFDYPPTARSGTGSRPPSVHEVGPPHRHVAPARRLRLRVRARLRARAGPSTSPGWGTRATR